MRRTEGGSGRWPKAIALTALAWVAAGCGRGGDPAPAATAAPVPAVAPAPEQLHGGRTVAWWEERLAQLRSRTDPEGVALYAATRRRAEANGFDVREQGSAVKLAARTAPSSARSAP